MSFEAGNGFAGGGRCPEHPGQDPFLGQGQGFRAGDAPGQRDDGGRSAVLGTGAAMLAVGEPRHPVLLVAEAGEDLRDPRVRHREDNGFGGARPGGRVTGAVDPGEREPGPELREQYVDDRVRDAVFAGRGVPRVVTVAPGSVDGFELCVGAAQAAADPPLLEPAPGAGPGKAVLFVEHILEIGGAAEEQVLVRRIAVRPHDARGLAGELQEHAGQVVGESGCVVSHGARPPAWSAGTAGAVAGIRLRFMSPPRATLRSRWSRPSRRAASGGEILIVPARRAAESCSGGGGQ